MLNKLIIKNIALIDYAEIDFTQGLNVLSGETGSGKSVIIESLNFVLGAKADKTLIRSGTNECEVCAVFDVSNNAKIFDIYNEQEIDTDDSLIIVRKFSIDGKNSIKINGNIANVSILKKFTSILVDVHGQSSHYDLLSNSNQLKLLDKFGGDALSLLKENVKNVYSTYKEVINQLNALGGDENQRLIRLDVLNFQINEIENSNIKDGEEEELLKIKDKLKYQEKILTALNTVKDTFNGENGVDDLLNYSIKSINGISSISEDYNKINDLLSNAMSLSDEIISSVENLIDDFDYCKYSIEDIEQRIDVIKNLKRKYGDSYASIINFLEQAKKEKENLENFSKNAEKLLKQKIELEKELYNLYSKLRDLRVENAKTFCKNVSLELDELGMDKSKFEIKFSDKPTEENCKYDSANGFDTVDFMFSANLGEPIKPLSFVISGGEMSRFMLAVKAQSAKYNDISTYIFDEIDAGISGIIAKVVAHKLVKISKNVQVISITHLPQISVFADNNLLISKNEINGKTITNIKTLNNDEKVDEITRLVGGSKESISAKNHALELINEAIEYKKSI